MQGGCLSSGLHSSFHVWAVRKRSVQHLEEHSEVRGSQGDGGQEGSAESQDSCWAWGPPPYSVHGLETKLPSALSLCHSFTEILCS